MNAAHATYQNGQLVLDEPVDWPSGTRTVVVPEIVVQDTIGAEPDFILRDEDWPSTPEQIAEWLAWFDSREPVMTPEEQARFEAELKASKAEQIEFVKRSWEQSRDDLP